ncbi:MAG: GAF domain-containing protein, partial [Candidatus Dormibacteraeota bacterium]|nr:GAF domain-containing protein [Candidatus Dormibacteraeota bacterium]
MADPGVAAPSFLPDEQVWAQLLAARRRATALYDLSTLIASANEIPPIVELLLTQARQVFGADRAAVFLQRSDGRLYCANAVGLSATYLAEVQRSYMQAAGGRVADTAHTVYIADAPADPLMGPLQEPARHEGFRTLVLTPFNYQGRPIGALALYHDLIHPYSEDDIAALNTFANHVAVALTNARLFAAAERQVRRSNFLAEAGRLLNSSLDLHQVLQSLTRAATAVLGEACAIYLLRRNDDILALAGYAEQRAAAPQSRQAFLDAHLPRLGEPGIGHAALHGEVLLVDGRQPRPGGVPDPFITEFGACAYLVLPLLAQDRLLGALVLWLFTPSLQFNPDDTSLARELADRAAVALENARLYERELRAQKAKDAFLSFVSHELRTPLTAIIGYTQLIRKGLQGEPTRLGQQMNIIWSQAQRLHRLVETILDISNLEQGELTLNLERLDLREVVQSALERLRAGTRPGLVFVVEEGPCCWVMGDRWRLEQVFSHLLANAIKYSPPSGTVRVVLMCANGQAEVQVVDQGPGMTAAQLGELFQRYYRGDTPLNRSGGLGLGLYV